MAINRQSEINKLKKIRSKYFGDADYLKNKIEEGVISEGRLIAKNPLYAGIQDINKKAQKMLDKANGRD